MRKIGVMVNIESKNEYINYKLLSRTHACVHLSMGPSLITNELALYPIFPISASIYPPNIF